MLIPSSVCLLSPAPYFTAQRLYIQLPPTVSAERPPDPITRHHCKTITRFNNGHHYTPSGLNIIYEFWMRVCARARACLCVRGSGLSSIKSHLHSRWSLQEVFMSLVSLDPLKFSLMAMFRWESFSLCECTSLSKPESHVLLFAEKKTHLPNFLMAVLRNIQVCRDRSRSSRNTTTSTKARHSLPSWKFYSRGISRAFWLAQWSADRP